MIFDPSWISDSTFMRFQSQQQDQLCMTTEQHKGMAKRASSVAWHGTHGVMLMLDTGNTKTSTPFKGDFISFTKKTGAKITGIASKLEAKGEGLVKYHIKMYDGTDIAIHTMANHVPDLKYRLLSPQGCNTSDGNPIEFSTYSHFRHKKGWGRLKVHKAQDGWEESEPIFYKTLPLNPNSRPGIASA